MDEDLNPGGSPPVDSGLIGASAPAAANDSGPIELYPTEPEEAPGAGRNRRGWLVVAAPVVVVLIVAGFLARRPDADGGVPGPRQVSTPRPDHVVDLPTGSPTDGLGTKMLPVRATPDKGLVDGQSVLVVGSGFPAHVMVGGVMCTGAAKTQGVAACDLTNIGYNATTDAEGSFQLTFPVRRYPLINGQHVDCATGNVDPDDYAALLEREGPHPTTSNPLSRTCVIAVGEVANYDNSGGWPIAFEGETFLHGDPTTTTGTGPVASSPDPTAITPVTGADPTTTAPVASTPPSTPPLGSSTTGVPTTPASSGPTSTTVPGSAPLRDP